MYRHYLNQQSLMYPTTQKQEYSNILRTSIYERIITQFTAQEANQKNISSNMFQSTLSLEQTKSYISDRMFSTNFATTTWSIVYPVGLYFTTTPKQCTIGRYVQYAAITSKMMLQPNSSIVTSTLQKIFFRFKENHNVQQKVFKKIRQIRNFLQGRAEFDPKINTSQGKKCCKRKHYKKIFNRFTLKKFGIFKCLMLKLMLYL
eukprot:TRINITY_DN1562_c1_g1_i2.p2 TRINITY_DN1562_c1_g1~~TRINITY_DN1562_c1_g1_i2.p2  ORF type:complete len:203 (+),score=-15.06 TRINITY_DN1562_c1_g1_i2:494-1102(+)